VNDRTHFIDGAWSDGVGTLMASRDPATQEIVWEGRAATDAEVHAALTAAAGAFERWADREPEERVRYLEAFRESLKGHRESLAESICRDTGKPFWEALTEVDAMAAKIDVSVEAYYSRRGIIKAPLGPVTGVTRFRPHGVVAVFGPFNLPGHLPNGHLVPALLAGNTVVFKPSEQAPLVAQRTVELWESVGLPAGVLNMVQGGRETGTALAAHGQLAGLFFTGSAEVGKSLHRSFGGRPEIILALEMGGNNPLVVHEVSDVRAAAYFTIESAFITSGQRCTCARRLIVPGGEAGNLFIAALTSAMRRIRVGRYLDRPEPFMGPVISETALEKLLAAQQTLREQGAAIILEMERLNGPGNFLTPGLLDVSGLADRPDVELFGPILQLVRVDDFDSAIREANNMSFGLSAALLSDNGELYERFLRRIRAGVVNWNRQTTGASGRLPFGGVGASGNHRPSGYFAADYCSFPVASMETDQLALPHTLLPGVEI
jgi:succinylglutamic semialdehyde dehydrogenase